MIQLQESFYFSCQLSNIALKSLKHFMTKQAQN
jgi:hypothetical protein